MCQYAECWTETVQCGPADLKCRLVFTRQHGDLFVRTLHTRGFLASKDLPYALREFQGIVQMFDDLLQGILDIHGTTLF